MGMQWVKQSYKNISDLKDDGVISKLDRRGKYEYETAMFTNKDGEEFSRKCLLLNNGDIFESSAVKIEVASGYKVRFLVQTENNNYWADNSDLDWWQDAVKTFRADNTYATLDGNSETKDYLSIDIDEEFANIANFRLRENGVMRNVSSPENPNNEVRIWVYEWFKWMEVRDDDDGGDKTGINDPLLDSDNDGLPNDVDGDDDNDGVPDTEDYYPFDPTRSEKEQEPPEETEWVKILVFTLVLGVIGLAVFRYMGGMKDE